MTFQEIEDRLCAKYEKGNTRAEFVCEMFYSLVPMLFKGQLISILKIFAMNIKSIYSLVSLYSQLT